MDYTYNLIRDRIIGLLNYEGGINGKAIAIFPFGKNGLYTKQVLNEQFNINEKYIVDNELCQYNEKIISLDELLSKDEEILVILTVSNLSTNRLMEKRLKEFENIHICNLIDPIIGNVPEKKEWFDKVRMLLNVKAVKDFNLVRVGRKYDGGYLMLNDFASNMTAYSFGICDDMSWDKDVNFFGGMRVNMYDHTIDYAPEYVKDCIFFKKGIGVVDNEEESLLCMKTILTDTGNIESRDLILKMDIEGAEWDIFDNLDLSIISQFRQMVFELHDMVSFDEKKQRVLEKINRTHQAIWVHGNNYGIAEKAGDVLVPNSFEVLFVRRDLYQFLDERVKFPFEGDMPNLSGRKDYILDCYSI